MLRCEIVRKLWNPDFIWEHLRNHSDLDGELNMIEWGTTLDSLDVDMIKWDSKQQTI